MNKKHSRVISVLVIFFVMCTICTIDSAWAQESDGTYEMDSAYSTTRSDTGVAGEQTSDGRVMSPGAGERVVSPGAGGRVISTPGSGRLTNPVSATTLDKFILKIIEVLLIFAVPIIVLYIMYAGYLFVTANGEAGQISQARTALLYAVIGGVIVLGAELILKIIQGTISAF